MSTRVAELLEAEDFTAAAKAFAASPSPQDAELLFAALEQLDRDDELPQLEASLQLAEALVASRPSRDDAHLVAIECLRKLGRADDALAFAREHAGRPAVRSLGYQLLCLHGHLDEAAAMLPVLAGLPERLGTELYNLGARLHAGGRERAVALYQGAVAIGTPGPQAAINLGIALLSLGRSAEAAESARAGLAKYPVDPNLLANAIDASVRAGDKPGLRTLLAQAANALGKGSRCQSCGGNASASCAAGCAALLEDMANAWIFLGDDQSAVMAIEAACGQEAPAPRVRYALARALAAGGTLADASALVRGKRDAEAPAPVLTAPACLELMHTPPSVTDAASAYAYRALAALAWAAGDPSRAAGALCAALFLDPGMREQLMADTSWAALRGREPTEGGDPLRPPAVPEEAWWDGGDKEWVLGPRDKQNGAYKYFRVDGTCCNESSLEGGKPHGPFLRFHENGEVSQQGTFDQGELHGTRRWNACDEATTEHTRQDGMSMEIWASEIDYAQGRVVEIRHYDRAGNQCAPDGTRYPSRPAGVAASAAYYPEKRHWRYGEVDNEGNKRGAWRTWNEHGRLIKEEGYHDDELHGPYRAFHADGSLAVEGEYADGSQEGLFTYLRGPAAAPPARARSEDDDDEDDEDEDDDEFPTAGLRVVKIQQLDGRRRYFDAGGHETMLDGRTLDEVKRDPWLASWLSDLERVDWSQLECASGKNPPGYALISGLIAEDEGGHEKLSDAAWGALYWHFCHQGTIYSGTAAAVPFLIRLLERKGQPHRLALFAFLRAVSGSMRGTYQRAIAEGPDEGWADYLATAAAYAGGYEAYRRLLDDSDPAVRSWAARLLGSCHGTAEAAARALAYRLIGEREPGVRGNILQSIGNLGTDGADHILRRSLGKGGLEQICAGIGMVMCKPDDAGIDTVSALVGVLAEAHVVEPAFSELPWSELSIYGELANTLAQAGHGAPVLDDVLGRLDQVDALGSVSIARTAVIIAKNLGGEDDEDDDGDGGSAMRKVMRALAAAELPWQAEGVLGELLEELELPTSREELAAAGHEEDEGTGENPWASVGDVDAESEEEEAGDEDSEDSGDEVSEASDDEGAGEDGAAEEAVAAVPVAAAAAADIGDGWDDASVDDQSEQEGEEEEDDDSEDDDSEDDDSEDDDSEDGDGDGDSEDGDGDSEDQGGEAEEDDTGHRASALTTISAIPSREDFASDPSSQAGLGRQGSVVDDLDDEIDRSLGMLDDSDPDLGGFPRMTAEMAAPRMTDEMAIPRMTDEMFIPDEALLSANDPATSTTTSSRAVAEPEGFLENDLLEDDSSGPGEEASEGLGEEPSGGPRERPSSRSFARPGSDAWLSDVRKSDGPAEELDIAELGSIDADLEDDEDDKKSDDDGWNN